MYVWFRDITTTVSFDWRAWRQSSDIYKCSAYNSRCEKSLKLPIEFTKENSKIEGGKKKNKKTRKEANPFKHISPKVSYTWVPMWSIVSLYLYALTRTKVGNERVHISKINLCVHEKKRYDLIVVKGSERNTWSEEIQMIWPQKEFGLKKINQLNIDLFNYFSSTKGSSSKERREA